MGRKKSLLVVDDDELLCRVVEDALSSDVLDVRVANTASDGLTACSGRPLDVVVLDQHLPDGEGHALCPRILAEHENAKVIFITASPSFEAAVLALKNGAYDYLAKPFDVEALQLAVERALDVSSLERSRRLTEYKRSKEARGVSMVGTSAAMSEVERIVDLAAEADAPVLVTGETGTGKGLVARQIHARGSRASAPFVTLNCAAMPDNLVEAELFGWERGAFTGSVASREGLLEMAEGGTLFLDEIGEMPPHLQAKLLSIFEDGAVRRLGGRRMIPIDARLVAATNAVVEERIADGSFRSDLYYRLNVFRIHVPPLRERTEDIPALCENLLSRILGREGPKQIADEEVRALARYSWPGNVRELRNVLERACLLHGDTPRPSVLLDGTVVSGGKADPAGATAPEALSTLDEVVREHVQRTLAHHGGNLARSARSLGIALSTLKRKIHQFGLG